MQIYARMQTYGGSRRVRGTTRKTINSRGRKLNSTLQLYVLIAVLRISVGGISVGGCFAVRQ